MRYRTTILTEPIGGAYQELVHVLGGLAASFHLVVRPNLRLEPTGQVVLAGLEPYLLRRYPSSTWPGTELLWGTAEISELRVTERSLSVLAQAVTRLYEWRQPAMPEDLCFFDSDGLPRLVVVAHEADSYLDGSLEQLGLISGRLPGLRLSDPVAIA